MNGRLFSRRPGRIIMSTETRDGAPALMRLLQLSSPMLPVGAYAYSQGLEHAVHAGWVRDERTAHVWIGGVLRGGLMRLDVPVLARLYHAWHMADDVAVHRWSSFLHASRESAELQQEDRHLGQALARLLRDLEIGEAAAWMTRADAGLALADDDIGNAAPGLALGSALHENQYSRLFRS